MRLRGSIPGRILWILITLVMVVIAIYVFRIPLLRATGDLLIDNDPLLRSKAIYVLGGSAIDRGAAAGELLNAGIAPAAYCMGELVPVSLEAMDILINEGELTARVMRQEGTPTDQVHVIPIGTSTMDESFAILDHARQHQFDTIMVVTTEFHSRRVGRVFRGAFKKNGITVLVHGAPSSRYDSDRWWESEEGLLMVNNEYVKSLYYAVKY